MLKQITTIASITCREALNSKLLWLALGCMLLVVAVSELAGEVVVSASAEFQAGIVAWGLRWLGVLTCVLFFVNSLTRESSDRITELLFAQPVKRESVYLGRLCALILIATCYCILAACVAAFFTDVSLAARWAVSLFFEIAIVGAFALWVILGIGNLVGSLLVTLAFYLVARSIHALVAMVTGPIFVAESAFDHFMVFAVELLSWVLPPLHTYASADWLIANAVDAQLGVQMLQTLLYLGLLGTATVIELYRKQY
ncbi:MAG: hypothetical protein AAF434_02225 [Pseudomonadota bacterium]